MPAPRVSQLCDVCHLVDHHPRHHSTDGQTVISRHFDCCASTGCDTCAKILAKAPPGARHGDNLTAYLERIR